MRTRCLAYAYEIELASDTDVDQSGAIKDQLAAVPDGTIDNPTLVYFPPGRYRADNRISVVGRSHLRLTCPDGMFTSYTDVKIDPVTGIAIQKPHVDINRSTNVVVSRFNVDGPNTVRDATDPRFAQYATAYESQHAFATRGATRDSGFEDCTFQDVYGDGFYTGRGGTSGIPSNVWAKRIGGTWCGRQAAGLVCGEGVTLEDYDVMWNRRSGIDVEPNGDLDRVYDLTLRRVTVRPWSMGFSFTGSGSTVVPDRRNFYLRDCVNLSPSQFIGSAGVGGDKIVIDGYTCMSYSSTVGMSLGGWLEAEVRNSRITSSQATPTTQFIRSGVKGSLTVTNCNGNGRDDGQGNFTSDGFDELVTFPTTVPASYTHCGNVWRNNAQSDGPC